MTFFIACETLDVPTWSVVAIPRESTSTSIYSMLVVELDLISTKFVPLIILFILSISSSIVIVVLGDYVCLVDCLVVLSIF